MRATSLRNASCDALSTLGTSSHARLCRFFILTLRLGGRLPEEGDDDDDHGETQGTAGEEHPGVAGCGSGALRLAGLSCSMEGVSPDPDALGPDDARLVLPVGAKMFSSMTLLMR